MLIADHISIIRKINKQITINVNFDNGLKRILDAYDITLKVVHRNDFSPWIYNPIFTHPIILIIVEFADIILRRIPRRNDFDDKIRCTITAFSIQFVLVTNYHNIRLYDCKRVIIQFYIKWGIKYPARAFLAFDILPFYWGGKRNMR